MGIVKSSHLVGADALIGPPFDRLTVKPFDRYILSPSKDTS